MADESGGERNFFPFYEKREWRRVFHVPSTAWHVEALWEDAYFHSAKHLIHGVRAGVHRPAIEGVAGLYLFRHYLELGLKFLIFHSRWLEDPRTNAEWETIKDVEKTHSLSRLWRIAEQECKRILPAEEWRRIDVPFLSACIADFDAIDPSGERFRYHGDRFGVHRDREAKRAAVHAMARDLSIDFDRLATSMDHVYEVLNYLDLYMVETHGQNADWQAEGRQDLSDY